MSIDRNALSLSSADDPHGEEESPPQRPVTRSEALKAGLVDDKSTYLVVTILWEIVVKYYRTSGLARHLWEPMKSVVQQLSAPFAKAAADGMVTSLTTDVDPALDDADATLGGALSAVESLEKGFDDVESPETNQRFSAKAAVVRVKQLSDKIQKDMSAGASHHKLVSQVLWVAAKTAPFVEALGLMVFMSYSYDVPWLAPWLAPLPWTVGLTVVLVLTFALKFFTEHSGAGHNHAREASFEGNKIEGERAARSRLGWGVAGSVVGLGITAAMVERAIVAMAGGGLFISAVLLMLAVLAGVACPIVSWMAVAFNGSTASREIVGVAKQLDRSRTVTDEVIVDAEEKLAEVDEIAREIVDVSFPGIADAALATLSGARAVYVFLRLQLQLPDAMPPVGKVKIQRSAIGPVSGTISNGLAGADEVSLQPILDRYTRLAHLRMAADGLRQRLAAIEPHPWDHGAAEQDLDRIQ